LGAIALGHATSTDLIHWKNKKIVLFPNKLDFIFSGSAVVDYKNSSGLGTKENPSLIAIFIQRNWNYNRFCNLLLDDGFPTDLGIFKDA